MNHTQSQQPRAVVVLSGGQDSTTCLYWALETFGIDHVHAITFDYGQRHRIELSCAQRIADLAGVGLTLLPINTFAALGGNALTSSSIEPVPPSTNEKLPNTFVPGRNLIFLSFAAAFAYQHGYQHLVIGASQTDYSGYPDCREHTLKSMELSLFLGMDYPFKIHAPLMHLSKSQTVLLAQEVNAMDALRYSHTCYIGTYPPCGTCVACTLRAKGFLEAGVEDPLISLGRDDD
jgi:7-cyano-7-deazaguanine synthase